MWIRSLALAVRLLESLVVSLGRCRRRLLICRLGPSVSLPPFVKAWLVQGELLSGLLVAVCEVTGDDDAGSVGRVEFRLVV